jgi:hypothetical protein
MLCGTGNIPLKYSPHFVGVFPLFTNNDQFLKFCHMRVLKCFISTPIPCEKICSGNRQEASRAWISTTVEAVWRRVGKPGEPNSYLSPLCKSLFSCSFYFIMILNTGHNIIHIHNNVLQNIGSLTELLWVWTMLWAGWERNLLYTSVSLIHPT